MSKRIILKKFFVCTSYICIASSAYASSDLTWGKVEFMYLDKVKIDEDRLLEDYPIKATDKATSDSMLDAYVWCDEKLRKRVTPIQLDCAMVNSAGTIHSVISLSNEKKVVSKCSIETPELLLNYKLIKIHNKMNARIEEFSQNNQISEIIRKSTDGKYYIGFEHKVLDEESKNLLPILAPYKMHLIDVILKDSDTDEKSFAEFLMRWVGLDEQDMSWIIKGLSCPEADVADNILKLLIRFPTLVSKNFEEAILEKLQNLFFNINYQVRLNSLIIANQLFEKNPSLAKKTNKESIEFIQYLNSNTILDEFKIRAQILLDHIKEKS